MTMLSYARNHQDVLLDRAFPRGKPGFYVDIGARDPVVNSMTKHFYDLGWHGINVGPAGAALPAFQADRPRDVNLDMVISGPGESAGPGITLSELCENHVTGTVDFLSVEAGGNEQAVLAGNDWTRWRPRIVVVAANQAGTRIPNHSAWEPLLLEAGYLFAGFDGVDRYYVRPEDADLAPALAVPVNVTDDYLPHGLATRLADSQCLAEQTARKLAVSQLANTTLQAEISALAAEVGTLREQYRQLQASQDSTRAEADRLGQATQEAQAQAERLSTEVAELRQTAQRGGVLGAGPAAVRLAQGLTSLSSRHPVTASSARKLVRLGQQAKRALSAGKSSAPG